ncbi:hypothetical protein WEI85_19560 [Actinomycetes bacterium KLBMP 9797]
MDARNRFETRATFWSARLEWIAALAVSVGFAVANIGEIRWWVFVTLFVVIDAVGYLPGAVAFRRSRDGRIPRGYYLAYNIAHNLVTGAALVGLWALLVEPEWALLAVPIHLFGDRALFGNTTKPFGVPFEPATHPAFADFERAYAASGQPTAGRPTPGPSAAQTTEPRRVPGAISA